MQIFYGVENIKKDVTEICLNQLLKENIITIPSGDHNRATFFSDPIFGIVKSVFIKIDNNIKEFIEDYTIFININNKSISFIDHKLSKMNDPFKKLSYIHDKLQIKYGNFLEELPEQKMAATYLSGNEKILEIGGNIGRNSLIISYIIGNNPNNFVVLECDSDIAKQLSENRDLNQSNFHIETSALSKRKLIQKGWDTIPSDILLDGYSPVNTITLDNLKSKYNIVFDTLVLDCEGSFYYILMDMPEILDNINLIIMENDYYDINKKNYIDKILKSKNFYVDFSQQGGWGPCYDNFFEVWKRR